MDEFGSERLAMKNLYLILFATEKFRYCSYVITIFYELVCGTIEGGLFYYQLLNVPKNRGLTHTFNSFVRHT